MTLRIKGATTIKATTTVGFSPASLFAAGEQGVWYDPSDFTTMFQDTAGTTPVTATGQSVARINDKSGRGNNATQSTLANQPTLQIDGNGKYYLSFNGTSTGLVTGNVDLSGTSNLSIFAGMRKLTDTSFQVLVENYTGESTIRQFLTFSSTASASGFDAAVVWGAAAGYFEGQTPNNPAPVTDVFAVALNSSATTSATAVSIRKNAIVQSLNLTSSGTYISGALPSRPLNIGRRVVSGTPSLWLNGRIYGLIIRGAASTSDQITATENYMNGKTAAY